MRGLQPVDAASLGLQPLEAHGHLVRLPGEIAPFVAADNRDGGGEVTLAEAAESGGEAGHTAEHVAADPEGEQEHHDEGCDAEGQPQLRTEPLGFRRCRERVGQLRLVEDGGLVEELRDPRLSRLHLAHLGDDSLAGLAGDELPRDHQRLRVKVLHRLSERGGEPRFDGIGRGGKLLQELLLQLYRPGELVAIAGCDGVLECALDPFELPLELWPQAHFRQVVLADVVEVSLHTLGNDRAGQDQGGQREAGGGDEAQQLRAEREIHAASVHFQDRGAAQGRPGGHVADGAWVAHHERNDCFVVGQLGRGKALA